MDGVRDRTPFGGTRMKIWIDLGNSPHVPFFAALAEEFAARGHDIVWTARDYAQTVELSKKAGIDAQVFGTHGGKNVLAKAAKFAKRVLDLTKWARGKRIDLVVSHNSQEPLVAARMLGIRSVNLMDYEHHPGNHLSFRAAKRVIVPASFPDEALEKFGAAHKVGKFDGIKEDVYLSGFHPDLNFSAELKGLGIEPAHVLAIVRPHAPEALYHRGVENRVLDMLLDRLAANENVRVIVLPRKDYQGDEIRANHPQGNIIFPKHTLDGGNLIAAADLVISGGGTMNREAAALGVPAYTVFAGKPASIDSYLASEGRLVFVRDEKDIDKVRIEKKAGLSDRGRSDIKKIVADLILED
jgi:predicted glycosyltransferase